MMTANGGQMKVGLLLPLLSTLWQMSAAKVVVGAVLSKSPNSILMSQPVNVTVEPYDEYQSFAVVSDNAQGSLHGVFQLLQEDGTKLDVEANLWKVSEMIGNCTQAAVFTILFNDILLTELCREANTLSNELLIEVQFQYYVIGKESRNEQSDVAYIQVSLDRFCGKTTSPDANPTSTENSSTEGGDVQCNGKTLEINGSSPSYSKIHNYILIICFVFTLMPYCY